MTRPRVSTREQELVDTLVTLHQVSGNKYTQLKGSKSEKRFSSIASSFKTQRVFPPGWITGFIFEDILYRHKASIAQLPCHFLLL